ncbi:Gti1/Pac2 family-domain-containing protein [Mycena pura]|uniref:Gti1/Pac2 family-domain-containing protein n=1 Tax=Mycena pura TaxID=153505 RepID=A0AAD6VUL9_9AGAR|nr:Gti1/Pac2 family-domain-containing protein [Mycena pura]
MQHAHCTSATHPALRIRNIIDACRVVQAVRLNVLPLVKRRLTSHERAQLKSGNVFVWVESEIDGLVRWTEGRQWSKSRMRGDCLIYEEKIETTENEKRVKAARRAMRAYNLPESVPPPLNRKDRPTKADGLTKHTYTVTAKLPEGSTSGTRKWHLVAYFSSSESHLLPVVEDYEYLKNIQIPVGFFGGHGDRSSAGCLDMCPRLEFPGGASSSCPVVLPADQPTCFTHRAVSLTTNGELRDPSSSCPCPWNICLSALVLPPISPVLSPTTLPPLSSLDIYRQKCRPAKVLQPRLGQFIRRPSFR